LTEDRSEWAELAEWWHNEVSMDSTYRSAVVPLVVEIAGSGQLLLDLGCGEGQMMQALSGPDRIVVGCDINAHLLGMAAAKGPTVRVSLPDLECFAGAAFDGAVMVLVLEHVNDADALFAGAFRIVRPGGWFALVVNHPIVTAPGSASVVDPTDGEVFWRPGTYLTSSPTLERAGDHTVTFHHRPLGALLTTAARSGWVLEELIETDAAGYSAAPAQSGVPTLLAARWVRPGLPPAAG